MTITPETFRAHEARRRAALDEGDAPPTAEERERAEKALQGVVFVREGERADHVRIGRRRIDWSLEAASPDIHYGCLLNMFFTFLDPLATVYAATRDERYAAVAREYIEDWMRAHPEPPGRITFERNDGHELSLRLPAWSRALYAFLPSASWDGAFFARVTASLCFQAGHLCDVYGGRDNKVVAMADALVTMAIQFPECPAAARWRRFGVRGINEVFHRQFLPDGAHFERVPHYHEWMMSIMDRNWRLGRAFPELGLALDTEAVARMYDYDLAATRPNGEECALHDSHGTGSRKRATAGHAGRKRFRQAAGWPDELPPCHAFFPDAGQAFLRDSWDPDALYLTFDATRNYPPHGHTHLGANSVQLCCRGRALLSDAGYVSTSDPLRDYACSTRAHNTVTVNGWDQSKSIPLSHACHRPGYDLVQGRYLGGYYPRPPAAPDWITRKSMGLWGCHDRFLLWAHGRYILIVDAVRAGTRDEPTPAVIECNWQFGAGPLTLRADGHAAVTGFPDANLLALFPWPAGEGHATLHTGETDPPRGWLPGGGIELVPAPQVCVSAPRRPCLNHFVTVLVPFPGAQPPKVAVTAYIAPDDSLGECRLRWGDGSADEIAWSLELLEALYKCSSHDTESALLARRYDHNGAVTASLELEAGFPAGQRYEPGINTRPSATRKVWMP